jgi:hypothetical protein
MSRAWLAMVLTLGLTACDTVSPQLTTPPAPAPPTVEFGSIVGNGAFRTPSGGRGTCAGYSVVLVADTPQSQARMWALYGSVEHAADPIAQVKARSTKLGPPPGGLEDGSTQCDAGGHFSFSQLRAGAYFVIARVHVRTGDNGQEDMVILQHVLLRAGETREVGLVE